ncbi:hypothetical protein MGYG_04806 [Nannizzia gypsea CBS 118893]|uniref:Uncharacterized protein n=1 Tax=Arthroderma gypseum (strain ATCC MYA-4604 / CBS 118893) TaxID=535722 RepID=E4UWV2_ARTGP|nr:hypothetical protein MGYG_04806 [Nannizzia gypsea CBS 118893]EFR01805.1 hypothetical protein MGYG_04806 [Nannizzia gypsea CBS 118893]
MSNAAHLSNSPPTTPIAPRGRRASITEMFARPGNGGGAPLNTSTSNTAPLFTAAASNAQQQPHRRRMSITTLGLSGSPTNQPAPFGQPAVTNTPTAAAGTTAPPPPGRRRRGSVSSSILSSSPTREQAVAEEEDDEDTPMPSSASPFARRVSFSFRDRAASINGEGFNWPEALRTRAERAPSLAGSFSMHQQQQQQQQQGQGHGQGQQNQNPPSLSGSSSNTSPSSSPSLSSSFSSASFPGKHHRSASVATMEAYKPPPKELLERHPSSPPPPPQQQQPKPRPKPDYFQEKILRADFMD